MNPHFDVTWMPQCGKALERLSQLSQSREHRLRLGGVLREAKIKLARQPREWGDPIMDLHGMDAILYNRVFLNAGLSIRYAVHRVQNEVFVQAIIPIRNGIFDFED